MGCTMNLLEDLQSLISKQNDTVLDIGCGNKFHSNYGLKTITIDAWDKLDPDYLIDVTKKSLPFKNKSFDIVTMLDFIEHLKKEDGYKVLNEAIRVAKKRVIILTPLFWNDNSEHVNNPRSWAYKNPYNYHLSLWTIKDFSKSWNTKRIYDPDTAPMWLGYLDLER